MTRQANILLHPSTFALVLMCVWIVSGQQNEAPQRQLAPQQQQERNRARQALDENCGLMLLEFADNEHIFRFVGGIRPDPDGGYRLIEARLVRCIRRWRERIRAREADAYGLLRDGLPRMERALTEVRRQAIRLRVQRANSQNIARRNRRSLEEYSLSGQAQANAIHEFDQTKPINTRTIQNSSERLLQIMREHDGAQNTRVIPRPVSPERVQARRRAQIEECIGFMHNLRVRGIQEDYARIENRLVRCIALWEERRDDEAEIDDRDVILDGLASMHRFLRYVRQRMRAGRPQSPLINPWSNHPRSRPNGRSLQQYSMAVQDQDQNPSVQAQPETKIHYRRLYQDPLRGLIVEQPPTLRQELWRQGQLWQDRIEDCETMLNHLVENGLPPVENGTLSQVEDRLVQCINLWERRRRERRFPGGGIIDQLFRMQFLLIEVRQILRRHQRQQGRSPERGNLLHGTNGIPRNGRPNRRPNGRSLEQYSMGVQDQSLSVQAQPETKIHFRRLYQDPERGLIPERTSQEMQQEQMEQAQQARQDQIHECTRMLLGLMARGIQPDPNNGYDQVEARLVRCIALWEDRIRSGEADNRRVIRDGLARMRRMLTQVRMRQRQQGRGNSPHGRRNRRSLEHNFEAIQDQPNWSQGPNGRAEPKAKIRSRKLSQPAKADLVPERTVRIRQQNRWARVRDAPIRQRKQQQQQQPPQENNPNGPNEANEQNMEQQQPPVNERFLLYEPSTEGPTPPAPDRRRRRRPLPLMQLGPRQTPYQQLEDCGLMMEAFDVNERLHGHALGVRENRLDNYRILQARLQMCINLAQQRVQDEPSNRAQWQTQIRRMQTIMTELTRWIREIAAGTGATRAPRPRNRRSLATDYDEVVTCEALEDEQSNALSLMYPLVGMVVALVLLVYCIRLEPKAVDESHSTRSMPD